ncbi:MAG: carboxypeptidase-like regulatory domain-containing protein [Prevotellaceae bacterium]|jgi:hypothetical protein|nr:carboxypeptidase-like regulatory domain-containing protein [Prevotellaceae bacterium]
MYRYFCFFILCISNVSTVFSQDFNGYIVSQNNKPVAYSSVYLSGKQTGIIADSAGRFRLPYSILDYNTDTLTVSSTGYKSKKIAITDLKKFLEDRENTIMLENEIITLEELIINSSSNSSRDYGFFNLKSANIFISGKPGAKICVFIENEDAIDKIIQNINIKTDRQNDKTKKLRLFFCSKSGTDFVVNSFGKDDIIISDFSKKNLTVDVSRYSIPFTKEGIYVGIEWISQENQLHDRSEKIGLSIKCTTKCKNKPSTWIYTNEKWELFPALTEEELKKIPKFFRNKITNANVQIGITAK